PLQVLLLDGSASLLTVERFAHVNVCEKRFCVSPLQVAVRAGCHLSFFCLAPARLRKPQRSISFSRGGRFRSFCFPCALYYFSAAHVLRSSPQKGPVWSSAWLPSRSPS
ncbi:unnamed protein product, partial [Ectocarpus sp. 4 AP-2014]